MGYTLLCATGLEAEAKIARGAGMAAVVGGADHRRTIAVVEEAASRAECLVSFGIAGALSAGLKPGDIVLSTEVIDDDRRWLSSETLRAHAPALVELIGAVEGPVLGARTIIATEADKRRAWEATGAIAVDLESVAVARAGAALGIPFLVLRAIADPARRSLPPAAQLPLSPAGRPMVGSVLASLLRRPQQLPALLAVAREARQALVALAGAADALSRTLTGA